VRRAKNQQQVKHGEEWVGIFSQTCP